ncbi:DUF5819 family protein [Streptomyces sp. NPDC127077]|uniref:DUF5819 family protein n=1 Tax=Streptomyces sp. NPDC127077 TaxID=3347131 RepID=UPI00365D02E2
MDARHEGSEREPGSAAPEEGAPGVTGATPLPGPRPADEAVPRPGPRATGPGTGATEEDAAEPSAEPESPESRAVASAAAQKPTSATAAPALPDEPTSATAAPAFPDEPASATAAPALPDESTSAIVVPAPAETPASVSVAPALPEEPASAPADLDGTASGTTAPLEYPGEAGCPGDGVPGGLAALSLRSQIVAALALAVVAVAACTHLGMVFLHVAPSNTVTKQHGRAIDDWIYPEFEQNWKLFAPNPLQQDIAVQVRALVRTEDGTSRETGWYDLSALDGQAIDGNPLPSHTQQNELRRAWDFYAATHDGENRAVGLRGDLSERYLRRIGVLRLHREHAGGEGAVIERLQFRSLTTDVPPPPWSDEKVSDRPVVRELPWWAVPPGDRTDGLTEASAR